MILFADEVPVVMCGLAKILVDLSVGNVNFEAKTFTIYRSKNTNFSNYSCQVSIDEQRRAENAFDRVKRKE